MILRLLHMLVDEDPSCLYRIYEVILVFATLVKQLQIKLNATRQHIIYCHFFPHNMDVELANNQNISSSWATSLFLCNSVYLSG